MTDAMLPASTPRFRRRRRRRRPLAGSGWRPSAATMCDATVSLPPLHTPSTGAACSRRIAPGSRTRPSGSRIARGCATLNSSETPPSSSPSTSSSVIRPRPAVVVLDERLVGARSRRNASSRSAGIVSRTRRIGRSSAGNRGARPRADVVEHDILGVEDADQRDRAIRDRPAGDCMGWSPRAATRRRTASRRRAPQTRARDHQLPRGAQAEAQRTVQAHLLERLEQAAVAAFGDQQLDLFRRMDVAMPGRGDAQQLAAAARRCHSARRSRQRRAAATTASAAPSRARCGSGSCSASDFGTSSPRIIAARSARAGRRRRRWMRAVSASSPSTCSNSGAMRGASRL